MKVAADSLAAAWFGYSPCRVKAHNKEIQAVHTIYISLILASNHPPSTLQRGKGDLVQHFCTSGGLLVAQSNWLMWQVSHLGLDFRKVLSFTNCTTYLAHFQFTDPPELQLLRWQEHLTSIQKTQVWIQARSQCPFFSNEKFWILLPKINVRSY